MKQLCDACKRNIDSCIGQGSIATLCAYCDIRCAVDYANGVEMSKDLQKCDMCGSAIENGRCGCGRWEETLDNPTYKALLEFHEMKRFTFTGDAPHLGCAVVFFRGDYNDSKKVEKFIHTMKGRPYYEELS